MQTAAHPGTLHVVATPIGNLGDLRRARSTRCAAVAAICAEDTRHTRQLLSRTTASSGRCSRCTSTTRMPSRRKLVARLRAGESLALVSDAGTPLVSDPGFPPGARRARGRHAREPGAGRLRARSPRCASPACPATASCSKASCRRRPRRAASAWRALAREPRTLVFYESAHRIEEALADCVAAFGASAPRGARARTDQAVRDRARRHAWRAACARSRPMPNQRKGEFVLMVRGRRRRRRRAGRRRPAPVREARRAPAAVAGGQARRRTQRRAAQGAVRRRRAASRTGTAMTPQAAACQRDRAQRGVWSDGPKFAQQPFVRQCARRSRPDSRVIEPFDRTGAEESPGSTGHGAR